MTGATCKTCLWWEPDAEGLRSWCHHVLNQRDDNFMPNAEWWCSEHPDRKGMSDAELIALTLLGTQAAWVWAEEMALDEIQRRNARRANQEEQS